MNRTEKEQFVQEMSEQLNNTTAVFLADYRGINVEQATQLRRELTQAGVEYRVVKNNLLKLAAKFGVEGLSVKLHDFGLDLDDSAWDKWIGEGNTVKLEEFLVNLDLFNEDVSFDSAVNQAIQTITVWDQHPPYYQHAAYLIPQTS